MSEWIYPKDLAAGIDLENYPKTKIPVNTQNAIRKSKRITYSKIGKNVVYTKEWILEYIKNNIRKAEEKAN